MPPLEAKKTLVAFLAASWSPEPWRGGWRWQKLKLIDVKKAHLNGVVGGDEHAYIARPGCCAAGMCGRLRRWLYGMRPAAKAWEEDYAAKLVKEGYKRGVAAPTVFQEEVGDVSLVVHGDDFTVWTCR